MTTARDHLEACTRQALLPERTVTMTSEWVGGTEYQQPLGNDSRVVDLGPGVHGKGSRHAHESLEVSMFGCQTESAPPAARPANDADNIVVLLRHQPDAALLGCRGSGSENSIESGRHTTIEPLVVTNRQ